MLYKFFNYLKTIALCSLALMFSVSANAAPVVWNLSGVTFTDGGVATGSFTYDADTDTYSSINITTTAGSVIATGNTYNFTQSGIGCDVVTNLCLLNSADGPIYTGDLALNFAFSSALTNAGGTVTILGRESTCDNSGCSSVTSPLRFLSAGSVTTDDPTYSVGGTVSGVDCGGPPGCLWLENNGGDAIFPDNGPFTFPTELADGSGYSVTVAGKPGDQTCTVAGGANGDGTGTISGADVGDITVTCGDAPIPTYSVGAIVSGGNGNVTCSPPSVSAGGSSTCTASPNSGFQVSAWTGDCASTGTSNTCSLTNIQADKSSTVSFEASSTTPPPAAIPVMPLWLMGLMALVLAGIASANIRRKH